MRKGTVTRNLLSLDGRSDTQCQNDSLRLEAGADTGHFGPGAIDVNPKCWGIVAIGLDGLASEKG